MEGMCGICGKSLNDCVCAVVYPKSVKEEETLKRYVQEFQEKLSRLRGICNG